MRFKKKKGPSAAAELFVLTARKYLGYNSEALGRNMFGSKVGYDSKPWSGAFIDVVAREASVNLPSFVYTAAGLAESVLTGAISRVPQIGDIAIYNFPTDTGHAASSFSMPHAGIVTDVQEFKVNGRFITVEGNTDGGSKLLNKDGVHQKIRSVTDVLLFCRPGFTTPLHKTTFNERFLRIFDGARTKVTGEEVKEIETAASAPSIVKINGGIRFGDRNKKIELLQLALSTVTDLRGCELGKWDTQTKAACSRYQRNIGRTGSNVTGLPDQDTLLRLSKDTGLFVLEI
jgi:hypothetical protein